MQKTQRIENGVRGLPKGFEHGRERGFGGSCSLRVTSHAVDHDQEDGIVGGRNRHPILVFFAMSDEADIGGFDLQ